MKTTRKEKLEQAEMKEAEQRSMENQCAMATLRTANVSIESQPYNAEVTSVEEWRIGNAVSSLLESAERLGVRNYTIFVTDNENR